MWRALFNYLLALGDVSAFYLLSRTVTSPPPSERQLSNYLAFAPIVLGILITAFDNSRLGFSLVWLGVNLLVPCVLLGMRWPPVLAVDLVSFLSITSALTLVKMVDIEATRPVTLAAAHCISWCILWAIARLVKWLNRQRHSHPELRPRQIPWPAIATFALALGNYLLAVETESVPHGVLLVNYWLSLGLAALGVWLLFITYGSMIQTEENQQLKFYVQTIETLTLELRQFRHNYRNILHGLAGYIDNQEWTELKEYFRDVVRETEQAELNSYALALKNVTNYALFGLLSEKMQYAKELGVNMDLNVLGIFGDAEITATDLCQVMGVFLDNAIEAASQLDSGHVLITLRNDGSFQQIVVSNSCLQAPFVSRTSNGNYSTKGPGRGSGLYFAQRVLGKYQSVLHNTMYADGEFRQELIIPVQHIGQMEHGLPLRTR